MRDTHVHGLVHFVHKLIVGLGLNKVVLVGNSLGGQIALVYALQHPSSLVGLALLGSSGIYELQMGTTTFKRRDRTFIRKHAAKTFYDPAHANDELVERIFQLANDRNRAARLIRMARSSRGLNLTDRLWSINVPTTLIWGEADQITPLDVAHQFNRLLPTCELHCIDQCGHAPMMEHPDIVNRLLLDFIPRVLYESPLSVTPA